MNNNTYFGAIDIGSNAVRLVVKSIEKDPFDNSVSLSQDLLVRFPLRLGEDAFTQGKISSEKITQLLHLMKSFRQMLKIFPVINIRACATSAMRDAKNGEKIARLIQKNTGIEIEIIDGEEEASIIYETHIERELGQEADYMYMDVGGGSTQISLIHSGKLVYSHSFNIGTVRMMNNKIDQEEMDMFIAKLQELRAEYPTFKLVGSGGNINKLNKLLLKKKDGNRVNVEQLKRLRQELSPLTTEARMKKYRIKRDRAEVIDFAAHIFTDAANAMQIEEIIVPSINITDGIVNKMFLKYLEN
ncbi:MAG: Ppx/GppA family phosphatase [Prevotellaceae bacterium]|jgi:exopolyphosphatase/guanosine-5'-triphosphate,3'-diphosphate pyrophosphatase|nr:Ppx/GppA family phosphatase [Prevotellaceae bacterium]